MDTATQQTPSAPQPGATDVRNAVAEQMSDRIYDILGMDEPSQPQREPVRGPDGKFAKADDGEAEQVETEEVRAEAGDDEAESGKDEGEKKAAESDDDDPEVELPPEAEGKEPTRLKLSELVARATRAAAIEAELTDLKSKPIITPEQWDRSIEGMIASGQQYANALRQWQQTNIPQPPHPALSDPNSQHYDPDSYARQMHAYNREVQRWQDADAERQRVEGEVAQRARAKVAAQVQRHRAMVLEFWPELKSEEAAQRMQRDLIEKFGKYGMTADLIAEVDHPAFYALAKAALEGSQEKAVRDQVAKAVQARPKLIKGQARQTAPSNPTRDADFKRLAKTGRLEDAYAIAGRLFG